MGNSFSINGTDLSGTAYGLTIDGDGYVDPWMPKLTVSATPIAYSLANVITTNSTTPRTFDVPCVVTGTSQSDLHTKMDNIVYLFLVALIGAQGTIAFDHIADRYWLARMNGGIDADFGLNYARFKASFICPDSRAFGTATLGTTEAISAGTHDYVYDASATAGNAEGDPLVYVRNTSGSAVTTVTLGNVTQGATVTWTGSLPNGYWLRFNCDKRVLTVSKSGTSGTDATALSYTDSMANVSGYFPSILPRTSNTVRTTGIGTGTFKIAFNERYV